MIIARAMASKEFIYGASKEVHSWSVQTSIKDLNQIQSCENVIKTDQCSNTESYLALFGFIWLSYLNTEAHRDSENI